jgi:hypothetical protein
MMMETNMRIVLVAGFVGFLPVAALAQTQSPPSTAPSGSAPTSASMPRPRGGDITRDEYIQRAVERARHSAETRFDRMDTNHDGVLTADERRAAREARRSSTSQ